MAGISRRTFLSTTAAFLGAIALFPTRLFAAKKALSVPLESLASIAKVGSGSVVKIQDRAFLLIRSEEKKIRAFSALCTHDNCPIMFNSETKRIDCHCHKSYFDLDGKPISGPAKKALQEFPTKILGDKLLIAV